ncbi:MAG TPA: ParA family protein, partial [Gemmatimonadaceae bacterium]
MKKRILVATLKGGPGKTTTAWHLALGLARRGHRVAAIDADPRSQGLDDWYRLAMAGAGVQVAPPGMLTVVPWRPVEGRESTGLVPWVEHIERELSADRIVIDTGGEHPEIFAQACVLAEQLICPVGPMTGEQRRMPATLAKAAEVDAHSPITVAALLTRVPAPGVGAAAAA